MYSKKIYKYAIERADGHIFKLESDREPSLLLKLLRRQYVAKMNTNLSFCQHINRIPIAIYKLEAEYDSTLD